jgi:hypothetical protein
MEGMTAAALAATLAGCFPEGKRISQRTASYTPTEDKVLAKLGWRYQPIPFAVPSKRDSTIGRRWANSSMSKGRFVRNHSKLIRMISLFSRDGAPSMPSVASSKGHLKISKKCKLAASLWLTW